MEGSPGEVTVLLAAWRGGDKTALDSLVPVVYKELRRTAHRYLRLERRGRTCDTTDLVNEVYLRLGMRAMWSGGIEPIFWRSRLD